MSKPVTVGDRIAKVLSRAGVASRRDAERMISEGRVRLNGKPVTSPAINVTPADKIEVDGKPLPPPAPPRLWLYYKPSGLVTTLKDEEGRPTVFDNLPEDLPYVMSIGRLDLTSEGLLILTNDGEIKRRLELPSTGWLRRYRVRINGSISEASLDQLRQGLTVDGVEYLPMEVAFDRQQGANAWLTIGLREGKNREIRRVMDHLGVPVNRLIRVSYGPFQLGALEPGGVEEVKQKIVRDQLGLDKPEGTGKKGVSRRRESTGDKSDPSQSLRKLPETAPAAKPRSAGFKSYRDGDDRAPKPRGEGGAAPRPAYKPRGEGGTGDRPDRTDSADRKAAGAGYQSRTPSGDRPDRTDSADRKAAGAGYQSRTPSDDRPARTDSADRKPAGAGYQSRTPSGDRSERSEGYKPRSTPVGDKPRGEAYKPRAAGFKSHSDSASSDKPRGEGYKPRAAAGERPEGYKPRSTTGEGYKPRAASGERTEGYKPRGEATGDRPKPRAEAYKSHGGAGGAPRATGYKSHRDAAPADGAERKPRSYGAAADSERPKSRSYGAKPAEGADRKPRSYGTATDGDRPKPRTYGASADGADRKPRSYGAKPADGAAPAKPRYGAKPADGASKSTYGYAGRKKADGASSGPPKGAPRSGPGGKPFGKPGGPPKGPPKGRGGPRGG